MPKELRFSDKERQEARQKLLDGVNELARIDQLTKGPRGRNIVLEKSYGVSMVEKYGNSDLPFFNTNSAPYIKFESNPLDPLKKTVAPASMK